MAPDRPRTTGTIRPTNTIFRMAALTQLVAEALQGVEPELERITLERGEPDEIASVLCDFVAARLSPVSTGIFYKRGTGIVVGLQLKDSRRIVLKVHRYWGGLTRDHLVAVMDLQTSLANMGLPAPRPLLSPEGLRNALVTVEEYMEGEFADGHKPNVRRSIAESLQSLVMAARSLSAVDGIGVAVLFDYSRVPLWPGPHNLRFDFYASSDGAEWIDLLARKSREFLKDNDTSLVIGHLDWRADNLGFVNGVCAVIYDWDSVALASEPVLVGSAAAAFTAGWATKLPLPSVDEMTQFVKDYEIARGRSFDSDEREIIDAANLLQCAYGARCQHSDVVLRIAEARDAHWIELLRIRSTRSLFD
jgi:hypothetical protein